MVHISGLIFFNVVSWCSFIRFGIFIFFFCSGSFALGPSLEDANILNDWNMLFPNPKCNIRFVQMLMLVEEFFFVLFKC